MGDSIATNLFVLGYAYQKGLIPVSAEAILKAIELNGVAVEANKATFAWGRRACLDRKAVAALAQPPAVVRLRAVAKSFDEVAAKRIAELALYQNAAYADRYRRLIERAREAESTRARGMAGFADAVARNAYKLMAYKDEYEVARLYTNGDFRAALEEQFEGDYRLVFHLAPPLLARRDPKTGELQKRAFGPWMFTAFKMLAKLKHLRDTPLDIFGYSAERRMERRLIAEYEAMVEELCGALSPENHAIAAELARIPEQIRGYGHVKEKHLKTAKAREDELRAAFRNSAAAPRAAE
jgi:indolepyruvate ferredoxin oxidoreductase